MAGIEKLPKNNIRYTIGVMSGKGGVGKSTVSVLIAEALAKKGFRTGILDADITGPSIPKLFNMKREKLLTNDNKLLPMELDNGLKIVSMNLLLDNHDKPVIWRGPLLSSVVQQFWTEVDWGELDYLIIDMPPGTADIALTVMQQMPVDGLFIVTTPHDLVSQIVKKSIFMAEEVNLPVYGIIENMASLVCPHCNDKIDLFDTEDRPDSVFDYDIVASLPMIPKFSKFIEKHSYPEIIEQEINKVIKLLNA